MLLLNMFQMGGRAFITVFNNAIMVVFLTFATVQSLGYWKSVQNPKEANQVWLLFSLGLGLYAMGEIVWVYYNFTGIEAPYPSLGDLFWVFSYPLLLISLINRNRLLGVWPSKQQIAWVVSIGLALFVLIFYFILIPILNESVTARAIETALNFFYPIMDFLILITVILLVITLWKGQLSITWNIIAIGFVVLTFADILFVFATWNGYYHAEGTINLITQAVDLGYGLACMIIAVGVHEQRTAFAITPEKIDFNFAHKMSPTQPKLEVLPYTTEVQELFKNLYFMVDQDRHIFYSSSKFSRLCALVGISLKAWGKPLHRVLGVEEAIIDDLFSDILNYGSASKIVEITLGHYRIPVTIQATAVNNGIDVYLKYRQEDRTVSSEENQPAEMLRINEVIQSVNKQEYISAAMKEVTVFFMIEVQELYTFLVRMNGFRVGQILVEKFNRIAANKGANVVIQDGQIVLSGLLSAETMGELITLSLSTVRDLTTIELTQGFIRQLNEKLPENIVHSAQRVGLAL
jgi:hypothetical protein